MWITKTVEVEVTDDEIIEAAKQVIQDGYHGELLDTIREYAPDIIVSTAIELLQEYPELGKICGICGRGLALWIGKWAKANPDEVQDFLNNLPTLQ